YVTLNGVKIMARGAGGQMRGMRYGSTRPQLIILDDLEGDENVSTKDQMQKTRNWFNEDALPALDKDGMCLYLGTILCYDSLLDLVIRKDGRFESRRYRPSRHSPKTSLFGTNGRTYTSLMMQKRPLKLEISMRRIRTSC